MVLMRVNLPPSGRDLRVFSAILVALFGLLGLLVLARPHVLLIAATVAAAGFLVSIAFNGDLPRRRQLLGAVFPILLLAGFAAGRRSALAFPAAAALWALAVAGVVVVWLSPKAGRTLYVGWMSAALPVGWAISQALLAAAYYGVLTPIGLLMRAFRRDPLRRGFDRSAKSYWVEHSPADRVDWYFRQF